MSANHRARLGTKDTLLRKAGTNPFGKQGRILGSLGILDGYLFNMGIAQDKVGSSFYRLCPRTLSACWVNQAIFYRNNGIDIQH